MCKTKGDMKHDIAPQYFSLCLSCFAARFAPPSHTIYPLSIAYVYGYIMHNIERALRHDITPQYYSLGLTLFKNQRHQIIFIIAQIYLSTANANKHNESSNNAIRPKAISFLPLFAWENYQTLRVENGKPSFLLHLFHVNM